MEYFKFDLSALSQSLCSFGVECNLLQSHLMELAFLSSLKTQYLLMLSLNEKVERSLCKQSIFLDSLSLPEKLTSQARTN